MKTCIYATSTKDSRTPKFKEGWLVFSGPVQAVALHWETMVPAVLEFVTKQTSYPVNKTKQKSLLH